MKRLCAFILSAVLLLGMTYFSIGDEVCVCYDGTIMKNSLGQVNTVCAILLRTPADRESENKG